MDPYKGYWMLPGSILRSDELIEDNVNRVIYDRVGIKDLAVTQHHLFNKLDRMGKTRLIAINYIGLVDSRTLVLKREVRDYESEWFSINQIPKASFDHNEIINDAIVELKDLLVNSNTLKSLYPSDFTLPEIQSIYEQILNTKLDRRNFRKKFIKLDLIEDTGYMNDSLNGRPAKLYRFKETIKERDLF